MKVVVAAFVALAAVFVTDNTDKDAVVAGATRADRAEKQLVAAPSVIAPKPRQQPLTGSVGPQDRKRLTSSLFD